LELAAVTERVRGVPWMSPEQGALVYRHVRESQPSLVLELGTAYGASATYIAAALEANGHGRLISVDRAASPYDPRPLLEASGLSSWVTLVAREDSSYNWFLKEEIERLSDADGNCEPVYDFCYLDGAHNWTIDGLAFFLVEKLLKPGGWLLLDDLEWSYASSPSGAEEPFPLSPSERRSPHMRSVFDLLVRQHPSFSTFRVEDGNWGWAEKSSSSVRRYEVVTSKSLSGVLLSAAWKVARRGATAIRGKR
jgi:predicted O-methyltransferase YrrM